MKISRFRSLRDESFTLKHRVKFPGYQEHSGPLTNDKGFNSTAMYGVGLHLVAGGNTVTQQKGANLLANGFAGCGIRIENDNNTVINNAIIHANGEEGIGILTIWGSGTKIINTGTVEATGTNGTGIWFNASATKFDNTGTINAGATGTAIYLTQKVDRINFMKDTDITGNIVVDGGVTTFTFGKQNVNGESRDIGDSSFRMNYAGNFTGANIHICDIETWGGITTLDAATLNFDDATVGAGSVSSTLNLPGIVSLDELILGSTTNTISFLDGKKTGKVTISQGVENMITVQNLASFTAKNIENYKTINGNGKVEAKNDVLNKVGGVITNTGTMNVGGKIDNDGFIDTAQLVEANDDIANAGIVKNVVTLHSKTDIDNKTAGEIVDDQTVKADRDVLNDGTIDRFKTLEAGRDIRNSDDGTINVEQASTMTAGRDAVNSGLIRANGTVNVANEMTNETAGRIIGAGRIATTAGLVNDGTISAGNEPGFGAGKKYDTLNVVGPFTNNATGTFKVDIDPSHYPAKPVAGLHNDLVNVDGKATVNGGVVDVDGPSNDKTKNPTPARYVGNTKYIFLDTPTAGDLNVTAEMVANDPIDLLLFDFLADHDTKSYWLDVQREYYYGPFGDTINQRAVGYYLDDIGLDPDPLGDFFDVLVALDKLNSDAGIPHRKGISKAAKYAEDQMSGAVYGSIATSSIMNTTIVNNTLNDVLRRDAFGYGKSNACDPCSPCEPCTSASGSKSYKRNAWGLGFGTGGKTLHDGNAYGYDQSFGGTILGIDRQFKRSNRFGTYISYGEGRISSDLLDRSKSKELLVGLYYRKNLRTGYVLASGGLGYNQYDTERAISFMNRTATNEHSAFVGTVYGEYGLEFKGQYAKLQPFLGLQYVGNQQEGFTERGADSLNLVADETTGNSFRSLLGVRVSTDLNRSRRGAFSLFGQAVWMHEFLDQTYTGFTAQFSNPGMVNFSSTSNFKVRGNDPGRDWAILGAGLNYDCKNWRLFGGYDAYVNERQVLHTGNVGLAYGW